jgi:ubiquitin-conjugating enzyme E2 D
MGYDGILKGDVILYFKGPRQTPYERGIFYLRCHFPFEYPLQPPIFQLLTKAYHPNVDIRGCVCMDLLVTQWNPSLRTEDLLAAIASLLGDPNVEDPLVSEVAEQYVRDREEYNRHARAYTEKYAMQSEPPEIGDIGAKGRPWWTDMKVMT